MSGGPLLLADLGGTNLRLALGSGAPARPLVAGSVRRWKVADFTDLTAAVRAYAAALGVRPQRAVLAVAGLVEGEEVRLTNLPWRVHAGRLRDELGLQSVRLVNDFHALSLGIPLLAPERLRALGPVPAARPGAQARQTFAVVGPGTGLGVGALMVRGDAVSALETEAGHLPFAPGDALEIEILRRLAARLGRVCNEHLLSGAGLANLHRALGEIEGAAYVALAPEEISARAAAGDARCRQTLQRFAELLGAVAGDMVLALGAWQGVFLAGGMTPLLLPWLEEGGFRRRFDDKGRHGAAMAGVPSVAVLEPDAGLIGAAAVGILEAGGQIVAPPAAAGDAFAARL